MVYLLALAAVLFLAAGYFMMGRADNYLAVHVGVPDEGQAPFTDLALFAAEETVRALGPQLDALGITYDAILGGDDLTGSHYRLVCAAGKDDLQNLLICSLSRRQGRKTPALAVCNDPRYRRLFTQAGASCLHMEELTPRRIAGELALTGSRQETQGDLAC